MESNRVLAGVVAAATLLAGCSSVPAAPASVPASVPATSGAPATSAAAPAGAAGVDEFVGRISAAHKAVKTYSVDMSMETAINGTATAMLIKGVMDQSDPASIDMSMDMDVLGMKMKMLKVDGAMYMQLSATGGKWMKVPESQAGEFEKSAESADLSGSLEKSKGAMREVEQLADETIDGIATHHYRITMDSAGLADITGSDAKLATDTFDYDVWLDDASLLRKMAVDMKADADGEEVPITLDAVMGHYNEPVRIKAPRADDVVEMGG